jgi:Phosphotransferase system IIB components
MKTLILTNFIETYWWIFLIVGVSILAIVFLFSYFARKKKSSPAKTTISFDNEEVYLAFGGKDNIKSHSLNGSRLSIVLKDFSKLNREKIKDFGVERVLSMDDKYILVGKDLQKLNSKLD